MNFFIKNKYWEIDKDYNIDKLLYLLIDRPSIDIDNLHLWKNDKRENHREYDLPAGIGVYGYLLWYKNNKYNRSNNKPAIIRLDGSKEYCINGKHIKSE